MELKQSWSESYASFDEMPEWVADDNEREPATCQGASAGETLELTASADKYAGIRASVRAHRERVSSGN